MAIVMNDKGCAQVLKKYFNDTNAAGGNNLTLKLFCNNINPARGDTLATYTIALSGGYADITLTRGSWTVNESDSPRDAVYAQQTFTFTGELTTNKDIYGYVIVDADSSVIAAEKFGAIFHPYNNGDLLKVTPRVQMSTGTPS
jgi:hypothetical protein